nr:cache domain-containing protein [uncultured Holophaga sp.]
MIVRRVPVLIAAAILCSALPAQGPADAEALVKEAAAFAKANGSYKLIQEVNKPNGSFQRGELYIWIVDTEGVMLANAANPAMVGKDASEKADQDAVRYAEEAVKIALGPGSGWFDYKFKNPVTLQVQEKRCYVELHGMIIIACGAYLK